MSGPVTLDDLVRENKKLWAYCNGCGHEVDMDPFLITAPRETPVPDVKRFLVCSQCNGKNITTKPELYPGGLAAANGGRIGHG